MKQIETSLSRRELGLPLAALLGLSLPALAQDPNSPSVQDFKNKEALFSQIQRCSTELRGLYGQAETAHRELQKYRDIEVTGWNARTGIRFDHSFTQLPKNTWWGFSTDLLDINKLDALAEALAILKLQNGLHAESTDVGVSIKCQGKIGYDSKDLMRGFSTGVGPDGKNEPNTYYIEWGYIEGKDVPIVSPGFHPTLQAEFIWRAPKTWDKKISNLTADDISQPPERPNVLSEEIYSATAKGDVERIENFLRRGTTIEALREVLIDCELARTHLWQDIVRLTTLRAIAAETLGARDRAALVVAQRDKALQLIEFVNLVGQSRIESTRVNLANDRARDREKYLIPKGPAPSTK